VNQADAAELKTTLVGVPLPATQPDLLEYAVRHHAEPPLLDALRSLPDGKEFTSLDEVVEELLHVQPARNGAPPHEPKEESGAPPGGDAYTA
jgi:Protein of unknown function (DUF2795)